MPLPVASEEETQGIWSRRVEFVFDLEAATHGRYTYVRDIGVGGMARVIMARDTELDREVAVKVLEMPVAKAGDGGAARFVREAKITASLVHPGIVPVYDIGCTENGQNFFVMQVVEGQTLRELLDRANREEGDRVAHVSHLLGILVRVCHAIGYAHHRGIMHLDVKPMNIMEGAFGEVLVLDWGVAKRRDELRGPSLPSDDGSGDGDPDAPGTRRVVGTPGFMAPEQYQADPGAIGPPADVFALGIILYEILTGEKAFPGSTASEVHLAVRANRRLTVRDAAKLGGQKRIPRELAAICEKALSATPTARYPTAREFGEDVQAYLEHRAVSAFQQNWYGRTRSWFRRNPATGTAAFSITGTALLAMGVWLVQYYLPMQEYTSEFRKQVTVRREEYAELTLKAEWLKRQLAHVPVAEKEGRQRLAQDLRLTQTHRYMAAQHLLSAMGELLAVQRQRIEPSLAHEYRRLWLEEMELATREGHFYHVQRSFERMQEEHGRLPWWNWESDEFTQVERIRSWLKQHAAEPEETRPAGAAEAP